MPKDEQEILGKLREHASETRRLLSPTEKPERERKVVRAFLRCIGIPFSDNEIRSGREEPIDIEFRTAKFQITEILGGWRRGDDWRERERRYNGAKSLSDLLEPWTSSQPLSLEEISR